MNKRQLVGLGVPEDCINICIETIRDGRLNRTIKKKHVKTDVVDILKAPEAYQYDPIWSSFALSIIANTKAMIADGEQKPVTFTQWGTEIDEASQDQISTACRLPMAVKAALMPDAHVGYGLPIGGVLATRGHVIPYAVGVDIACRMRLSIIDMPPEALKLKFDNFKNALEKGTLFGIGQKWKNRKQHDVLDMDWNVTPITKNLKDKAWEQLGTSGSGNHFVEFGTLELHEKDLGIEKGRYVALLSHSGSRNPGATICNHYTKVAQSRLPKRYMDQFKFLAWLDMQTQEGQEYWEAMNLMGEYAAANHAVIHRTVVKLLGAEVLTHVENHHNFAWKEKHNGEELIVHRKGATPAGKGVLGVIPGSMADPGFVVRGLGNADSLMSASHGAGRKMSRTAAKAAFIWGAWKKELEQRGVTLLSGGLDEVPGAYKNIEQVMQAQSDLVEIVARFDPKIVKMCDDGSKAED